MHVCMYVCMYVCIHVSMYFLVCMYASMYLCMYVCCMYGCTTSLELNRMCNKRKEVMEVVDDLFVAMWLVLQRRWITQRLTVEDFGSLLNELSIKAKQKPACLLQDGEEALRGMLASDTAASANSQADVVESFSSF
jgi:hypothetical protein